MLSSFGPPIDLTDLPGYTQLDTRPRRSVFCGRVSTKDNQNPSSSIPRQVALAAQRLDEGEEFAGYFWDVESGMLPPESRGLGPQEMYAALRVPTPRDGGLQDLLDRAELMGVTHVLAERSDRIARAMLTSLTVEHELQKDGVEVVYANEPMGGTKSGQLRARRFSQVEAELYRAGMIEMSMGGQIQHAINGWNHGYAPYPYVAVVDENAPPPARGRFGEMRPKKKLVPHPDERRFDAAREMHRLRREEHLTTADIITVLSAEPDRYPIEGRWTHGRVAGLLANPEADRLPGLQPESIPDRTAGPLPTESDLGMGVVTAARARGSGQPGAVEGRPGSDRRTPEGHGQPAASHPRRGRPAGAHGHRDRQHREPHAVPDRHPAGRPAHPHSRRGRAAGHRGPGA